MVPIRFQQPMPKAKAKSILAIIDPTTGQNVLENLEMSSRQISNEVSGMWLNYEDNCIMLIGLFCIFLRDSGSQLSNGFLLFRLLILANFRLLGNLFQD